MKKKITLVVALSLTISILCSIVFGIVSSASESLNKYDLSKEASLYNKVLTSADILENYLGEELLSCEREYLISYGD